MTAQRWTHDELERLAAVTLVPAPWWSKLEGPLYRIHCYAAGEWLWHRRLAHAVAKYRLTQSKRRQR